MKAYYKFLVGICAPLSLYAQDNNTMAQALFAQIIIAQAIQNTTPPSVSREEVKRFVAEQRREKIGTQRAIHNQKPKKHPQQFRLKHR